MRGTKSGGFLRAMAFGNRVSELEGVGSLRCGWIREVDEIEEAGSIINWAIERWDLKAD